MTFRIIKIVAFQTLGLIGTCSIAKCKIAETGTDGKLLHCKIKILSKLLRDFFVAKVNK